MNLNDLAKEYQDLVGQQQFPELYATLIHEEYDEWIDEHDPEKELKELGDLVYVIAGYAHAKGWDLEEAVNRIHENNLGRCYQDDGTIRRRDDGKIVKNKNYPKVELKDLV